MKNIKKAVLFAFILNTSLSFAGGLLTNTNQSVHFLRNPARDASTEIDAVYTNPAGLIKLPEGFHFSINNQSAFQTRTITSTFDPFKGNGGSATKEFEGKASAPIIPSVMAAYRKGDWTLSGSLSVSGGGGKATFNNGLPSFEANISSLPLLLNSQGVTTTQYSVDQYMSGSSMIFGAQLGGTYKLNEMFSFYGGFRLNIVNNSYEGYLRNIKVNPTHALINPTGAMMLATDFFNAAANISNTTAEQLAPFVASGAGSYTVNQLIGAGQLTQDMANQLASGLGVDPSALGSMTIESVRIGFISKSETYRTSSESVANKELDCTQSGWGISPIIGANFSFNKLNIGAKYEFKTALNVENKTKVDDTGLFSDGVNTPHDIPALLTIGASYQVTDRFLVSAGYHHFFDSDAEMADNKQQYINGGTDELVAGIEFRINRMFLVSGGAQWTNYGVTDEYQKDLSFACNSYSIGLGGSVNVSPKVKINLGYFWTQYSDYTKTSSNYNKTNMPGTDVFSRTNKVFGAGVDFSF